PALLGLVNARRRAAGQRPRTPGDTERLAEQLGRCETGCMKQYSVDLRERLLGAIDAGLSQAEAARLFGVGTSTITRWRQRRAATKTLDPTPRPGRAPRIDAAQAAALQEQVAAHTDATLAEHCALWTREHDVAVSIATMSRTIRRLGITVKKSPPRHRTG
ncbi:MAG: IS630 transposase-related protein, partial [Actinobacteria bacterium]|nr:IS630 transposase-related protein [Actinomycetota bacterium]